MLIGLLFSKSPPATHADAAPSHIGDDGLRTSRERIEHRVGRTQCMRIESDEPPKEDITVYALLNEEQTALKEVVDSFAGSNGVDNPSDLDERDLATVWASLTNLGVVELRSRDADGAPEGSGVEVMVTAQSLASRLVPVPFLASSILASELLTIGAAPSDWSEPVARAGYALLLKADLTGLACVDDQNPVAWGGIGATYALALSREAGRSHLARVTIDAGATNTSIDHTQFVSPVSVRETEVLSPHIAQGDLTRWLALALTGVCADTIGAVKQALAGAVAYSQDRIAYGVQIGTFQAIQHLAADTLVAIEAAYGATSYASWAVDGESPATALLAARTAKAQTAIIGRTAAETVMQIYGGIGQTQEHIAHFYTRRALLNTELFGGERVSLRAIADVRLEGN